MIQVSPYLTFDGRRREAFAFYEQVLGGTLEATMTYGDSPMASHVPAEWQSSILHTQLAIGGGVLMGSDSPPDRYEPTRGTSVTIGVDDVVEAERIFSALAADGTVQMPIQETFWAARFGMLVDRFGTPWMINCEPAA